MDWISTWLENYADRGCFQCSEKSEVAAVLGSYDSFSLSPERSVHQSAYD